MHFDIQEVYNISYIEHYRSWAFSWNTSARWVANYIGTVSKFSLLFPAVDFTRLCTHRILKYKVTKNEGP